MIRYSSTLILLVFYSFSFLYSQRVTVSNEINIRSNISYDILTNLEDRILFYHDQDKSQKFEIYTSDLQYLNTIDLNFEKKYITPICVNSYNDRIHFYYTFRDTGNIHLKVRTFDKTMRCLDTTTLMVREKIQNEGNPRYVLSEDKSHLLIFIPINKSVYVMLLDNKTHEIIREQLISINEVNFKDEFVEVYISNQGNIVFLLEKNERWDFNDGRINRVMVLRGQQEPELSILKSDQGNLSDVILGWDEKRQEIILGSMLLDKQNSNVIGYCAVNFSSIPKQEIAMLPGNLFDAEWLKSETSRKIGKSHEFNHCEIRDIIPRLDGGVILITEMVKRFSRRGVNLANQSFEFYRFRNPSGLEDLYYEDIIIFANHPDGKRHWDKLLFKKQFSQDDNGIYSSYFLFKNQGRLRILYNDEIKKSNTVSEYIIDPIGNYERKSILSTEYQNLKLRFRDGIQASANTILVPSENSWKTNIVKIEFP